MLKISIKGVAIPGFIPVNNAEGRVVAKVEGDKLKLIINSDTVTIKIKDGKIVMVED
jgi:hypothetical protein